MVNTCRRLSRSISFSLFLFLSSSFSFYLPASLSLSRFHSFLLAPAACVFHRSLLLTSFVSSAISALIARYAAALAAAFPLSPHNRFTARCKRGRGQRRYIDCEQRRTTAHRRSVALKRIIGSEVRGGGRVSRFASSRVRSFSPPRPRVPSSCTGCVDISVPERARRPNRIFSPTLAKPDVPQVPLPTQNAFTSVRKYYSSISAFDAATSSPFPLGGGRVMQVCWCATVSLWKSNHYNLYFKETG